MIFFYVYPNTPRPPSIYTPAGGHIDPATLTPEWVTVEDEFVFLVATSASWIGGDFCASWLVFYPVETLSAPCYYYPIESTHRARPICAVYAQLLLTPKLTSQGATRLVCYVRVSQTTILEWCTRVPLNPVVRRAPGHSADIFFVGTLIYQMVLLI